MKTFLKAKCKKTGKWFGLEVEKIGSSPAVITNFVDITEEMANMMSPEYRINPHIAVGNNLIACKYCRSKRLASCSCNKKRKICKSTDKYDYQCVFCDELEINYSGGKENSIYNKIESITNLPASAFDKHGNPQGDQFDLAKDGSMNGFTVLLYNNNKYVNGRFNDLTMALEKKGFTVIYKCKPSVSDISKYIGVKKTQLWFFSDYEYGIISNSMVQAIEEFYQKGGSLYLWGENDPINRDASLVLQKIFHSQMSGNYPGCKVISIKTKKTKSGIIPDHPIANGIVNFFEGDSIASVMCNKDLLPLVYNSGGGIVTAYHDNGNSRVLADGGYTRTYDGDESIKNAGTERFVVNCAVWLANLEKYENKLPLLE